MKKKAYIRIQVLKNGESLPKLTKEEQKERDDPKRIEMVRALVGTCAGLDFAPDVTFKPEENECEPTIMWARCTYCSDEKGWGIRNRTRKGMYRITKKQAEEFAEISKFKVPPKTKRRKYIIETNFCCHCQKYGEGDQPSIKRAKLAERSTFKPP